MHFLREYLLLAKEIDISHDVVCDSPLEFRGKELSSLPRRSESPCPLEPMGFLSTVTEDKITVHCFIEGMQAPVIQWWQGKNYTDNVLKRLKFTKLNFTTFILLLFNTKYLQDTMPI